jgi:large subunit ribosomal protein L21
MFAIIRTGGKQYKVSEGEELEVELLGAELGQAVTINDVLMVANGTEIKIGRPMLAGAFVTFDILDLIKADKVVAYKYRKREGYHRKVGHRQKLNRVKVTKISA